VLRTGRTWHQDVHAATLGRFPVSRIREPECKELNPSKKRSSAHHNRYSVSKLFHCHSSLQLL
jgi:hypothetical protein